MGTYFTEDASKQDVINEILQDLKAEPYHAFHAYDYEKQQPIDPPTEDKSKILRRLDYAIRGNNLWILFEIHEGEQREVTVLVYKLCSSRDGWGYKPMDESMGPYEYNVPQSWASRLTPTSSRYAAAWRAKAFKRESGRVLDFGGAFDGNTVTSDADPGL